MPVTSRRSLLAYVCGVAAVGFVAATCSDLTGPTGLAPQDGGIVNIVVSPTSAPNRLVAMKVGDKFVPGVVVTINGRPVTRAQYVFATKDTSVAGPIGSADTIVTTSAHGDTLIAMGRGPAKIIVSLVGATIGGKADPTARTADTVDVLVSPFANTVTLPTGVSPTLTSLNATLTLIAESVDALGKATKAGTVVWSSSDPTIATVPAAGTYKPSDSTITATVTAKANGPVVIKALFDNIDSVLTTITVRQVTAKFALSSRFGGTNPITLNSKTETIAVTATPVDALDNPLAPNAAPQPAFTFVSSDAAHADIHPSSGIVTAIANGTAIVGVASTGLTNDEIKVTVDQKAKSITIGGVRTDTLAALNLKTDKSAISYDSLGKQTGNDRQQWTSSDLNIMSVPDPTVGTGLQAIAVGTARIKVTRDGVSDSITIVVTNNPASVEMLPDTVRLKSLNDTAAFASLKAKNANNATLTTIKVLVRSLDPSIVDTLPGDTLLIAKNIGVTFVVGSTANGKADTSRVEVSNAPAFVDITPDAGVTLNSIGDTFSPGFDFRNGRGVALPRTSVTWSSADPTIASVSGDGLGTITAVGPGGTFIKAVSPGDPLKRDSIFVTVTNAATTIVATPSPAPTLTAFGSTVTFSATVKNANGNPIPSGALRWSVPVGGGFVTIDPITGVATAVANGTATIRATFPQSAPLLDVTQDVSLTVAQTVAPTRSTITPAAASIVANGTSTTLITVQLKDANDNNMATGGAAVSLATSLGSLAPLPPADLGNGVYRSTLTSGTVTGAATITGTVGGLAITNNAIVQLTAGTASKYLVTSNNSTPVAGTTVTIRAQLADASNNPIATAGNAVTFSSTGGGSFVGANPVATDATGVAQITFTTSLTTSSHTITATSPGPLTGQSAAIVSTAGSAANYTVTPATTGPPAGSAVTISAQLRDANGNTLAQPGQNVDWSLSNGNGSFSGSATAVSTTDNSGIATVTLTASSTAGVSTQVRANFGSSPAGISAVVTTVSGAAAQLALSAGNGQSANVGTAVATPPAVLVTDANGNAVAGVQVTFAVASGGGSASGLLQLTNASGIATVGSWTLGNTIGPNSLTATAPGLVGSPFTFNATSLGTAALSVTQHGNEAGPVNIVYTVTLSAANTTGAPITFDVANSGGTATSGPDFTAFGGAAAISVANGATTGTLTVTVLNDALVEGTETVQATISNPSSASVSLTGASATANIAEGGATAALSVTTQGNEAGPVDIVYTVTLSKTNTTGAPITFDVSNSGGTATSGSDFTAFGGVGAISVANGATTGTLTVTVANDALLEATETVQATISNASSASITITGASATANITDNDAATAALTVTTQGSEAGPTSIVYTVTLSATNNTGTGIAFDVTNSGGTATSGSDFTSFGGAGAISVANGATTGTLTVPVINDAILEATETVQATISNSSNAAVAITTASATANITDNETATATLSVSQHGNEAGPTNIVYTVALSTTNNTGTAITFDVANSGGTATSGSDFTAFGGAAAISVANGATTGTLTVTVVNDAQVEGTETVQATISNSSNAAVSITGASATANLIDNDGATAALSVTTNGNEAGPVSIVYTVTLSSPNNTGAPMTFDVANSGGTATSGSDFTAFGGVGAISVASLATTGTLTVAVTNDVLLEGTETVQATISNASNASVTITGASATATITDNETATAALSVTTQGNEAGPVNIVYTVTLSSTNNTGAPITFDVANSGGTASSGFDFTAFGGLAAISVANGATTGTLTVAVANDALVEGDETVQATISNPSNPAVSITGASATATITDNDAATAALSVTTNGNEAGPVNIVYTVTLSSTNNTGAPITFDVANSGGTATSGSDFTAFGGAAAISVANGATTGTLTVTVLNDALLEATETVQATISNASSAAITITGASATANLIDNEASTAALSVTTNGNEAGPVNIVYTVTLSSPNNTGAPITFDVANSGGTATSGSDFTAFGGAAAIRVAYGATTGTLTVAVTKDILLEATETVQATISNASSASVTITGASATATITDNETATAALSVTTQGNEAGPVNIVYTVTLNTTNNTGAPITFDVANSGGTATSGSDFNAFGGSAAISVANGATTGTLTGTVINDALVENTESVQATISNPSSAAVTISTPTATANITDNDSATADLSVTTNGNEAGPVNIVYTVTLSSANNSGAPVTFDVTNSGGTATSGSDFTAFGGAAAISVANGATTGTLTVTVINDALLEATETVQATISNSSNPAITIGTATATANIVDNDGATAALSVTTNGNEAGPVSIVYTVTLSSPNNTGAPITFDVANSGGTATSGSDFTAFGGAAAISVASLATTGTLTVAVTNDVLLEGTETVQATISNASSASVTITGASAIATITDNETATAALSVTTQGAEAVSPTNIVYTVTLSSTNNTGAPITFNVANSGGTATSGSDFTAFGGVAALSVANGATTGTLTVTVLDDALVEGTETVQATISSPSLSAVTISTPTASANITDNDGATADLSVTQNGNEAGPTNIVFTVTLSTTNNTGSPITFTLTNSGGTATSAGGDFTAFGGAAAITVPNGATTGSLTVSVLNDALLEGTETVEATLSAPSNAAVSLGTTVATANLIDNETATAALSVSAHGAESATPTNIQYTVTLSSVNNTTAPITFTVTNSGGTATSASGDFTAFGGAAAISVAVGQSTGVLNVAVLDDALLEGTETVQATVSSPSLAAVSITTPTATANITDDETTTAALTVTTQGNEAGPVNIVYTVTLGTTNSSGAPITFNVSNSGGTATSGSDFSAFGGTAAISVANGSATGTLTVTVINDALLEGDETVAATISSPSLGAAVTITTPTATATITDNETVNASLSATQSGNEAGLVSIVYTVTLSAANNSGSPITFTVTDLLTGSATSGTDYSAFGGAGAISVANGSATGTLTVPVLQDALLEGTESVNASISAPSNGAVTITGASATANILDNETATAALTVTTPGAEPATNIVYTVTISSTNNTGAPITFDVANSGGTATSGADFVAFGGTAAISVPNGQTTGTLTVVVSDDALLEGTQTVQATISNPSLSAVSITTPTATANITDNESANADLTVTTTGNEAGPINIVYTVTLTTANGSGAPLTFNVSNSGGTATSGSDFIAFGGAGTLSVANGSATGTLTVTVINDALLEGTETVDATISSPSIGSVVTITTPTASANILDNEASTAVLSVTQHGNEAGLQSIIYTVTLSSSNNSGSPITFTVADPGTGSATSNADYSAFGGVGAISVANGSSTGSLTVPVLQDALLEGTETVNATISAPSNGAVTITGASATANILDNETTTAALSATQAGNEAGLVSIEYTVTLGTTNNTGAPITFDVAISGGTATAGSDFTAFAGTAAISVANGASTGILTVLVLQDALLEGTQTVQATISNPSLSAVSITTASATADILDDESANADLSVTTHGNEAGPVNIVYTVTLTTANGSGAPLTFNVANSGGTATSGSDFVAFGGAGTLSVANGATTGTLTVTVINDALLEGTETVDATISAPSIGSVVTITTPTASANILDNETASASLSATTNGNEAGLVSIVYTVTLSTPNNSGVPITFTVTDPGTGSATSNSDYSAFGGPAAISVANGQSTGTLTVPVLQDLLLEGTETVNATISVPSNGAVTISGASATANILDNETATANLSVTTQGVEGGTNIVYTVSLGAVVNNSSAPITFDVANSGGTATAGSDFNAFAGTAAINVPIGQTSGTLTVTVINDTDLEGPQTVQATISNPSLSAVSIGTASATATITDDEVADASIAVTTPGNEAGPVNIVYTVTLTLPNNSGAPITFNVASGGTATAGSDYVAFAGTAAVSVPNGASQGTLTVTVLNDALLEPTETVTATISAPSIGATNVNITGGGVASANLVEEGANAVLSVFQNGAEAATPTNVIYRVTLNKQNVTGAPVTFDLSNTPAGTATSGSDYSAFGGVANISVANTATTGNFTVTVLNDALLEATETVSATIANASLPGSVAITGATATANIVDNETATAVLSVTTNGAEHPVTPTNIVYTVTLNRTNNTGAPITFAVSNSGGTATSGSDFTAFDGPTAISVANGASTGTLTVLVTDDALLESTETVEASISDPSLASVTVITPTATANITESGATATLSANNPTEGSDVVFTVTLNKQNVTGGAVTFAIAKTGGTATTTTDHGAVPTPISVANGQSTGTVNVTTVNDALLELDETLQATITSPSNPSVTIAGGGVATATINESGATATLSANSPTEGSDVVFTVTLSKQNVTGSAVTFAIAKTGGTATDTDDHGAVPTPISVADGATTGTVNVTTVNDALLELDETLQATITSPSNPDVTIAGGGVATATINESGATATLSGTDGTEAGPTDVVFTVTLSKQNVTGSAVTFAIAKTGGTATTTDDHGAVPTPISVANGQSTGTVNVTVVDDNLLESDETIQATISSPSNADVTIVGGGVATAAIIDNESATADLAANSPTEGSDVVFTVTLSKTNNTGAPITFTILKTGGTATATDDHGVVPTPISVANGQSVGTVNVTTVDDALLELDETLEATISGSSNADVTINIATATATINESGATATLSANSPTEGSDVVFTVTLNKQNVTGSAVTFAIAKTGGTATDTDDHGAVPTPISVADGATTGTVNVTTVDDALLELDETLEATITSPSNADVTIAGGGVATATIVESGATINIVVETPGDETGAISIVYRIELSKQNVTGSAITIDYADVTATEGGTATVVDDYASFGGTASIANGASSTTVTVAVVDDAETEVPDETVKARISNQSYPAKVSLGTALATANIVDNDP
jgi:hypothetical protein